jgi:hypothetical protein
MGHHRRGITYGVGKGTALSGATLVRFGAFELQADGSWTLRAQTSNVASTAFTTVGGRQTHPYRTTTTLPRYYRLSSTAYGYAWGVVVVGTLTGGFMRGTDLNGASDLYPRSGLRCHRPARSSGHNCRRHTCCVQQARMGSNH